MCQCPPHRGLQLIPNSAGCISRVVVGMVRMLLCVRHLDSKMQDGVGWNSSLKQVPSAGEKTHTKHLETRVRRRNSAAKHRVPPQRVMAKGRGSALDPHHAVVHLFTIQLSQTFSRCPRLYQPVLYLSGVPMVTSWQGAEGQPHHAAPAQCPCSCTVPTSPSWPLSAASSSRQGCLSPS